MIVVTGANGQLGTLVISGLLKKLPASQIVAAVRTPAKANVLAQQGVQVRQADYSQPDTLGPALSGATKLLLISSSEVGQRVAQHKAVIDAAKAEDINQVAYTSILHADRAQIEMATEHLATEEYLRASGLPFVLLRNSLYAEVLTSGIAPALQSGILIGASQQGRFATATRAEFAEGAAVVLSTEGHDHQIYELAGDTSYTRDELAAEVSRQTGKSIAYKDLPPSEYQQVLSGFLPAHVAHLLAELDTEAASNALYDDSRTLSRLIGRSTESLSQIVAAALKTA